jgi:prepilin-type N-terminal cleavage/methylation domain-containing protein
MKPRNRPPSRSRVHDRGFSLVESMVASAVMLIGLLGLAGLQITAMRSNNVGKRMAMASLLAQDLAQNVQIWDYTDARLATPNHPTTLTDTNVSEIAKYWDLRNSQALVSNVDGSSVTFDFTDGPSGGSQVNQLASNYSGILSPVDASLPAGEQVVFQRYWNVFNLDLSGTGSPQGKLIQIIVRWKEANLGYRQVNASFYKYDPSQFLL